MKTDLTDTTAGKINKALVQGRRAIGTPAVGMVLTLVIVTDEENAYDALKAANDASREHPSRTLVVIKRVSRSPRDRTKSRLDAEVRLGVEAGTGETVVLRLYGEVVNHADSVVLPLLLPDAPVVVWWPVNAPLDPAKDPLGALAQRRVTDTYAAETPVR
ncbi:glucose-6-phosphate dehydrogenase assembly protein OpcA, partial [Streptomyces sp. NPDC048309]